MPHDLFIVKLLITCFGKWNDDDDDRDYGVL